MNNTSYIIQHSIYTYANSIIYNYSCVHIIYHYAFVTTYIIYLEVDGHFKLLLFIYVEPLHRGHLWDPA